MTQPERKDENRKAQESNVVPYTVGYGKPPVEHRFQKGQSGNPKGRAKGSANKPRTNSGSTIRTAEEYLRQEAYRPVTLREDGELIELPAIQAVFRAMGVAAMKGNRFAQKTMAELVTGLEERDHQTHLELMETMFEYKRRWSDEIERCEKHGLPAPEPIPHPDDVHIDPNTGDVRIFGPQTKEQKALYDQATERRIEAQEEVSYFADKYRKARSDETKEQYLKEWHFEQRMFDIINDAMPERYKLKLENRSYRAGASRAGEAMRELAEDRKRPPEQRQWVDYVGK